MASCGKIEYHLVIEEQVTNGEAKTIRLTRFVKIRDGSVTQLVEHRLAEGHRMLSYEVKLVGCTVC